MEYLYCQVEGSRGHQENRDVGVAIANDEHSPRQLEKTIQKVQHHFGQDHIHGICVFTETVEDAAKRRLFKEGIWRVHHVVEESEVQGE